MNTESTTIPLTSKVEEFDKYVQALAGHDWYYDYSDDARVHRAGLANSQKLQSQMQANPNWTQAYWAYVNYYFSEGEAKDNKETRDGWIATIRQRIAEEATKELITQGTGE